MRYFLLSQEHSLCLLWIYVIDSETTTCYYYMSKISCRLLSQEKQIDTINSQSVSFIENSTCEMLNLLKHTWHIFIASRKWQSPCIFRVNENKDLYISMTSSQGNTKEFCHLGQILSLWPSQTITYTLHIWQMKSNIIAMQFTIKDCDFYGLIIIYPSDPRKYCTF